MSHWVSPALPRRIDRDPGDLVRPCLPHWDPISPNGHPHAYNAPCYARRNAVISASLPPYSALLFTPSFPLPMTSRIAHALPPPARPPPEGLILLDSSKRRCLTCNECTDGSTAEAPEDTGEEADEYSLWPTRLSEVDYVFERPDSNSAEGERNGKLDLYSARRIAPTPYFDLLWKDGVPRRIDRNKQLRNLGLSGKFRDFNHARSAVGQEGEDRPSSPERQENAGHSRRDPFEHLRRAHAKWEHYMQNDDPLPESPPLSDYDGGPSTSPQTVEALVRKFSALTSTDKERTKYVTGRLMDEHANPPKTEDADPVTSGAPSASPKQPAPSERSSAQSITTKPAAVQSVHAQPTPIQPTGIQLPSIQRGPSTKPHSDSQAPFVQGFHQPLSSFQSLPISHTPMHTSIQLPSLSTMFPPESPASPIEIVRSSSHVPSTITDNPHSPVPLFKKPSLLHKGSNFYGATNYRLPPDQSVTDTRLDLTHAGGAHSDTTTKSADQGYTRFISVPSASSSSSSNGNCSNEGSSAVLTPRPVTQMQKHHDQARNVNGLLESASSTDLNAETAGSSLSDEMSRRAGKRKISYVEDESDESDDETSAGTFGREDVFWVETGLPKKRLKESESTDYYCEPCNRVFKRYGDFLRHITMTQAHANDPIPPQLKLAGKPIKKQPKTVCPDCNMPLARPDSLKRHQKKGACNLRRKKKVWKNGQQTRYEKKLRTMQHQEASHPQTSTAA
ncbi:hypothetical protein FISHEDRAFT_78535 [Fistulina hepatica ATCC 64428]|nr:hypothetical protein FISHEDRAFT_78535 [Fistulina hepatica ATCC 64428]